MKNKLEQILGFTPGRELKKMIITTAKDESKPIEEIAARYQMPTTFYDFKNTGFIDTPEGRIKIENYQRLHPWNKIIVIHGPKT